MNNRGIRVDSWSLTALQIEMSFNDTVCSHGTGSVWKKDNQFFLVTNWHNFTGKHRETGIHISKTNCEPTKVTVYFFNKSRAGHWEKCNFNLYDENGKPLWYEHPDDKILVDLVALKIDIPEGINIEYPNELPTQNIRTEIGSELFVVGYPFKIEIVGLPIWKRASLASELEYSRISGSPRFFIDTGTRQGMSGSLVIRKVLDAWTDENSTTIHMGGDRTYRLMGIYSGRLGANKDGDAQLGIVWPRSTIDELLSFALGNYHEKTNITVTFSKFPTKYT